MRLLVSAFAAAALLAQSPFDVAPDEYYLDFENAYVRIVRVTYPPNGKTPVHTHPALPTVFVYTSDGGPIRFSHTGEAEVTRKPVKQGQIRFSGGKLETHVVENLSDRPNNYLRVEMKTKPADIPPQDVRLDPAGTFENAMIRISRKPVGSPEYPAVDISYVDGRGVFREKGANVPIPDVRIEFKTGPVN